MKLLFILCLISSNPLLAADSSSGDKTLFEKSKDGLSQSIDYFQQKGSEVKVQADAQMTESVQKRQKYDYGVNLHYSPLDVLIPGKIGASIYFASEDKNTQYELQLLRSSLALSLLSVDFGKIVDQRISFLKRNYSKTGNFNWYYGLSYITFDATLGSSLLNNINPGNTIPNSELIDVQTIGLDLGLGHRWYFNNGFSISADWLGISQPLITLKKEAAYIDASTSSQTDKDNVKKMVDIIAVLPRLYTLKFSVGYNF